MSTRQRVTGGACATAGRPSGIMDPMRTSLRRTGLASVAVALLLTAAACGGEDSATDPVAEQVDTPSSSAEPTPDGEGSSAPAEEEPAEAGAVPVYYVGDSGSGPRLYREFRKVSGEPGLGAAEMAASGTPADPDYRSAFPAGGGFSSVAHEDGRIVVVVSDDSWTDRPPGMSDDDAQVALQSLVYTVQGALQSRDPVTVESAGGATTLFGIDTADGVANADQLEVLSLVNVTSPEQGAEVSGSFTATGVASSFEATVPWEVRDSSDAVVVRGFATAEGWMDALYPWETEVDLSGLAPGTYTFIAMTDDPSGGEGNPPQYDTKTIEVS